MKKPTLSVAIATYNEAANIKRCLDAVTGWVTEIVIADGYSTDDTATIAKKFPHTRVLFMENQPMFHLTKQYAIDACTSDWILQLDADEVVTPELKTEILKTIAAHPSENGFWINRQNFFLGSFLKKGGVYPDPTIRLYRRGFGRLPCKDVHEQAEITGKVGHLKSDLLHFSDPNFSRYLIRNDRYTSLLAADFKNQQVAIGPSGFIKYYFFKPLSWFFLAYFLHKGFADGFPGFVFAFYSSLRFPIAYTKYWEMSRSQHA